MAKSKKKFYCEDCGFESPNWMGRCSNCGSWNSMQEIIDSENKKNVQVDENTRQPIPINKIESPESSRMLSGIGELDRVLGGGVVSGSLILLGGAPGIGKSTLVLQAASLFSKQYGKVLYISAEESGRQVKLRAQRLKAVHENLLVLAETEFNKIEGLLKKNDYQLVIVDSIQTIYDSRNDSAPGSISQIKEITNILLKIAKSREVPVFLIGHITKKGELAGPRVLEHLVDAVLQFEGDRNYRFRILRAIKNRFGSTNEIGVFSMTGEGIKEVKNPSQVFLEERTEPVSGSVIAPVLEGSRIMLVEVQALVSAAAFSAPQRVTTGLDNKRISILLAVLEKKAGFSFQGQDVHLNITGGLKVSEPALDLPIITSIISSDRDFALPPKLALAGEIGLSGEIRAVNQIKKRIKEAKKMNFKQIIIPEGNLKNLDFDPEIDLKGVSNIREVLDLLFS
ncbi:MAG: DNA repair protein RadA [Halanaerobiaceae bacterium]